AACAHTPHLDDDAWHDIAQSAAGDRDVLFVEPPVHVTQRDEGLRVLFDRVGEATLPTHAVHDASNAAVVLETAISLVGRERAEAALQGLALYEPADMRQTRRQCGPITVIDDAYNANPDSMIAALHTLSQQSASRRVAVLGDMCELGGASAALHSEVIEHAQRHADAIVALGPMTAAAAGNSRGKLLLASERVDEAVTLRIASALKPGDVVLVKASRSMALERVVAAIESRWTADGVLTSKVGAGEC
ncbi:MAG: cyanophycin synthetase, partial [Planctomycetota bacterium]